MEEEKFVRNILDLVYDKIQWLYAKHQIKPDMVIIHPKDYHRLKVCFSIFKSLERGYPQTDEFLENKKIFDTDVIVSEGIPIGEAELVIKVKMRTNNTEG